MTLGTIGYVAPEQIGGGSVDARADLWAIGVMLYEMLTGAPPFRGEHEVSILHAVLHQEPPRVSRINPDLSLPLDEMIGALLQKDPEDRYQSAESLLTDIAAVQRGSALTHRPRFWSRTARHRQLRRAVIPVAAVALVLVGAGSWYLLQSRGIAESAAPSGVRTLAVLPFINDGGDPAHDYIVSGVTDELIALLERTPGLRLSARSSAAALQAQGLGPAQVGQQLGVAHLVLGTIRVSSDTLRLAARLTRVSDDATIWERNFAAPVGEAFAVERQVADDVLGVLRLRMARAAVAPPPTNDGRAYELYLKGRFVYNQAPRTPATLEQSLVFYRGALERDPQFALAHSGTAAALVNMVNFGYMPTAEGLARAEVAADKQSHSTARLQTPTRRAASSWRRALGSPRRRQRCGER